ncbi:MAG: acetyl/propionyl/methylcrotonyl-CoA carboxylase subunit alpha [Acidiferrobacterales bacterium]|nr:acetyl/propionyl/methylcrotonyl-CoA carboxylase subunit alpha [Acidiferrobacterales bacterium]
MIQKVLIANRGEIACRIIRTLDNLGITSVAVFSDADRHALHVSMASEAVWIGSSAASESYLQIDKIINAAKLTNADAVHPGYGFLSENPEFVRALQQEKIIFIGPDADSIEAMGLKDAAKVRMEQAGVPIVPGYHGVDQNPKLLAIKAQEIGYPVLIKARAGGGGKGMRKVESAAEFDLALDSARRESMASFGDDSVLIEKYVASPRHIEVQVFGDRLGNMVHLYERDCSLQRRHQKVIEEAPAPGMTDDMRNAMGQAAVAAAKAVHYVGAGTVEFIVDASDGLREDRFYFMEMNTRLQVEHPVTEAITDIDLVAWQIAVAEGKSLPLQQSEIPLGGHAMEARIYAEDADNNFLPATGTLDYLKFPSEARIDTGVQEGDTISPFYDPMIAKLIVYGRDRNEALQKLQSSMSSSRIGGSTTNTGFLSRLCRAPSFVQGDVTTALIENNRELLSRSNTIPKPAIVVACLYRLGIINSQEARVHGVWNELKGWRNWGYSEQTLRLNFEGRELSVQSILGHRSGVRLEIDGEWCVADVFPGKNQPHDAMQNIKVDGFTVRLDWHASGNEITVFFNGESWLFSVPNSLEAAKHSEGGGSDTVVAPMPGNIIATKVQIGDSVSEGEILIQMEAMKMEHSLVAARSGVIAEIHVQPGDQVEAGALLLHLEEIEEKSS